MRKPLERNQFPLALSWKFTTQKVQGLCRNKGVVNFDLQTQESSGSGQIYPALSRVRNYLKYFFLEKYSSE